MSWHRRQATRAFAPAPAESPVVMAISNNDRKHLCRLLAAGADPNAAHRDTCAMVFAAHRGDLDVIDLLRAHGGDINAQNAKGMTALMVAAAYQQHDLARALIQRGADINMRDKDGMTALMHAAVKKDHVAVDMLVRAGANTQTCFADGKTLEAFLSQPENIGLRATFHAAKTEAAKISTAVHAPIGVRKPLQIKHKQD